MLGTPISHPNRTPRRTGARAAVILLVLLAPLLFSAQPSLANSLPNVMTPDPLVFSGTIHDENDYTVVGLTEVSWSLLGVDTVLAKYTYLVKGTITGSVLPSDETGEPWFEFNITPIPYLCCPFTPEFANVEGAYVKAYTSGSANWFLTIEPLAPSFSFELSTENYANQDIPDYNIEFGQPFLLEGNQIGLTE